MRPLATLLVPVNKKMKKVQVRKINHTHMTNFPSKLYFVSIAMKTMYVVNRKTEINVYTKLRGEYPLALFIAKRH